ncbi:hypothetical protein [Pseudomonas sp. dw_358]|uniref:hypothetical protein n=1 Tax=Pseudomonas sp. dw_358 TaxID=2720083 RepID=UPI001BD3A881|nr:hypothetical protein [Pseudomonas sp. dw_358]
MSEDRELIELAAKAIGAKPWAPSFKGDFVKFTADGFSGWFSPLEFKDHALILAMKLDIDIEFRPETETVAAKWVDRRGNPGRLQDVLAICYRGGDKLKSTCRAITRAAAEIGRAMP